MKIFTCLCALVISFAVAIPTGPWARNSFATVSADSTTPEALVALNSDLNGNPSLIFRRDTGRTKCSPAQGQPGVEIVKLLKRLLEGYNITNDASDYFNLAKKHLDSNHFSKRVMTVPSVGATQAQIDSWYSSELVASQGAVYDETVSTAVFKPIKDNAISFGIAFLCGCTTLVVYSQTGVYIAHYYENISFAPDPYTQYGSDNGYTPEDAFQNTVIKGLTEGIKPSSSGATDGQDALAGRTAVFGGSDAKAWLIIPTKGEDDNPDPYRQQWNDIKTTVTNLYPHITYTEVTYEALDKAKQIDFFNLRNTARGKMLWKYDPQDAISTARKAPHQLIKLWSEYSLLDEVRF